MQIYIAKNMLLLYSNHSKQGQQLYNGAKPLELKVYFYNTFGQDKCIADL